MSCPSGRKWQQSCHYPNRGWQRPSDEAEGSRPHPPCSAHFRLPHIGKLTAVTICLETKIDHWKDFFYNHYQTCPPNTCPQNKPVFFLFKGQRGSKNPCNMLYLPSLISQWALVSQLWNDNVLILVWGIAQAVQNVWLLQPTGDDENLEQIHWFV